ncbi:MAG: hypothetical protein DRP29_00080 [Thermodesulfobacteriota bacterium]|nr:MAG: hypothetical protein DRP29_00080 [Thermodesulfobacteriota bacterium]
MNKEDKKNIYIKRAKQRIKKRLQEEIEWEEAYEDIFKGSDSIREIQEQLTEMLDEPDKVRVTELIRKELEQYEKSLKNYKG